MVSMPGLLLESGKGLISAVFTESMDLRPDWWIWHWILESFVELLPGAKKDGFYLCFYPYLFVISAEFIIWFFALGIAVEKLY